MRELILERIGTEVDHNIDIINENDFIAVPRFETWEEFEVFVQELSDVDLLDIYTSLVGFWG